LCQEKRGKKQKRGELGKKGLGTFFWVNFDQTRERGGRGRVRSEKKLVEKGERGTKGGGQGKGSNKQEKLSAL